MGSLGFACKGLLSYSSSRLGFRNPRNKIVCVSETGGGTIRWQVLEQMDKELSKGNDRAALALVKDLQGKKPEGLRCFGAARLVIHASTLYPFSSFMCKFFCLVAYFVHGLLLFWALYIYLIPGVDYCRYLRDSIPWMN